MMFKQVFEIINQLDDAWIMTWDEGADRAVIKVNGRPIPVPGIGGMSKEELLKVLSDESSRQT